MLLLQKKGCWKCSKIGENAATPLDLDDSFEKEDKYTEGKFVIVEYDGKPYVGQITVVHRHEIQIKCMIQKGGKN